MFRALEVGPSPRAARRDEGTAFVEIAGGRARITRDTFAELWRFREVYTAFVQRQVKVRYKQAAIGIGWAVIQPVAAASLFAVFLGRVADVPSDGLPYFLFALAGMACWSYFSSAAGSSMESLIGDQVLLRKVFFPREVLPLATVTAALVDLVPTLATLMVAAAAYGVYPSLTWIVLPVPVLVLILLAAAFGLSLGAVNVYYRDVRYTLPFVLQLGLFASPVVYPLSAVPDGWRTAYAVLNPVAASIDTVRRVVLHGTWPDWPVLAGALAWASVLAGAGYVVFKKLERGFSDRV